MDYVISGLPVQPFRPLFDMDAAALRTRGALRMVADETPGFPCRITLEDAAPGEIVLLLPWRHHDVDGPYRAEGPIFVRESARTSAASRNAVPVQQRDRLLSVRAFDAAGSMLEAEVLEGRGLDALARDWLDQARIAYLHVHNARRGCYACRIDRASAGARGLTT